jgi:hypothetical protein
MSLIPFAPLQNSKSILFKNLSPDNLTGYELQHRNNPRRHRDPLRPAHLRYRRAARAGRSHPARAGDYFRGKRIPPGLVQSGMENGSRLSNCESLDSLVIRLITS